MHLNQLTQQTNRSTFLRLCSLCLVSLLLLLAFSFLASTTSFDPPFHFAFLKKFLFASCFLRSLFLLCSWCLCRFLRLRNYRSSWCLYGFHRLSNYRSNRLDSFYRLNQCWSRLWCYRCRFSLDLVDLSLCFGELSLGSVCCGRGFSLLLGCIGFGGLCLRGLGLLGLFSLGSNGCSLILKYLLHLCKVFCLLGLTFLPQFLSLLLSRIV